MATKKAKDVAGVPTASVPIVTPTPPSPPPKWMHTFKDVLSIGGMGEFVDPLYGINVFEGYLDVYIGGDGKWKIRARHQKKGITLSQYEINIKRNIEMLEFEDESSYYDHFKKQRFMQFYMGTGAERSFVRFACNDVKRDDKMLRKLSTVLEYFRDEDTNNSPEQVDLQSTDCEREKVTQDPTQRGSNASLLSKRKSGFSSEESSAKKLRLEIAIKMKRT